MGLFKSDPPAPPNPIQTGAAQTGTNIGTAIANANLNNVNQVTPQGSLTYDQSGTYNYVDPTTGQSYAIPRFTATQNLSPGQQNINDLGVQSETNLATLARNQSGMLTGLLGSPMSFNGAPAAGNAGDIGVGDAPLTSYNTGGQQQYDFGQAGDITTSYGPGDFSADRDKVEQSLYARMDPQLQRDRASMDARLADQGIKMGSPAYSAAMDQFNRQLTDTRLGITQTAGQEQQRMMDMAAQRAGFQNAAQQQAFTEAQSRGTFRNQAQQQQYQQNALGAQFTNSAYAQQLANQQAQFNAQNQSRQNWMSEEYAQRNQPINEITALMSGSQVQHPSYVNTPSNQIPTTDIAGLINNQFSQSMDTYKQQSANFNSLVGGLFGAIGGLARSDRREKENIRPMGTIFSTHSVEDADHDEIKLPIYQYSFKDDPASTRHVGPMAQDVEKIDKRAVQTHGGTKYINMTKLGSILRAA